MEGSELNMFSLYEISFSKVILYVLAAVLPAAVLMFYIYRNDKVEKEPRQLLGRLLLGGVFAALASMALEYAADYGIVMYAENTDMTMSAYGVISAASVGGSSGAVKLKKAVFVVNKTYKAFYSVRYRYKKASFCHS